MRIAFKEFFVSMVLNSFSFVYFVFIVLSPSCFAGKSVLLSFWGGESRATSFFWLRYWVHLMYATKKSPLGILTLVISPPRPEQRRKKYIYEIYIISGALFFVRFQSGSCNIHEVGCGCSVTCPLIAVV